MIDDDKVISALFGRTEEQLRKFIEDGPRCTNTRVKKIQEAVNELALNCPTIH